MEGLHQGIFLDFLKGFEKSHPEFIIQKLQLPRKRLDLAMKAGEADVFSLNSPMFSKDDQYHFTDCIWVTGDYIVSKKKNPVIYKQPEDLYYYRVGTLLGNHYGPLESHINSGKIFIHAVVDYDALLQIFARDRVDCIIINKHMALYSLHKAGIDREQLIFSDSAVYEFELMPMIQKSSGHFLEAMNKFIRESKNNGFLQEVSERFNGEVLR